MPKRSCRSRSESPDSSGSSSGSESSYDRSKGRSKVSYKAVREKRGQLLSDRFGYTNENNPFGDTNLSQPFIWKKKTQLLEAAGVKAKQPEKCLQQTERKLDEIDRVRKRRKQREEEEKLLEAQQAQLAREREQEHYGEWQVREEAFHRNITRQRTNIRLKQGRERPIDLLVKSLRMADNGVFDDPALLPHSADIFVQKIPVEDLKDLLVQAEQQHEICRVAAETFEDEYVEQVTSWAKALETEDNYGDSSEAVPRESLVRHLKFWSALMLIGTVCPEKDTLEKRMKQEQETTAIPESGRDVRSGIALPVLKDLDKILEGKTESELDIIEKQVEKKLKMIRSDTSSHEDFTYWESIQEKLPYCRAVAELRRVHKAATDAAAAIAPVPVDVQAPPEDLEGEAEPAMIASSDAETSYQPPLLPAGLFRQSEADLLDPQEFEDSRQSLRKLLLEQRRKKFELELKAREVRKTEKTKSDPSLESYEKFVREETSAMGADEFVMTPAYEVPVETPVANSRNWDNQCDDKYRPRRPHFFNRVKTGYEWTKYNQSHFDRDNPPPKAVQGYKFTLSYPDLIDKTKAPTWKLLPSDTPDTVLIRFTSGPPYEDVMFKIVNREWDMNTRKGFRNTFDRGILQLHFHFKRFRYRK